MPGFKGKDNKSNIKENKVEEYTEAKELHRLGVESHKNGDTKKAEILYKKAIEYNYFNEGLVANLGIILKNKGALQEAELLYLKGIEGRYDFSICNINLARLYRQNGELTRGIEVLEKAICRKPNEANYYLELGEIYGENGLTEKGILAFQQCIKLNSKIAKAYVNLGVLYNQRAEYQKALEITKKALDCQPQNADAYFNLSTIYNNLGQTHNGILAIKKSINLRSNDANSYFKLGALKNEVGDYGEAVIAIRKAMENGYSKATDCNYTIAASKFGMEKYEESRKLLEDTMTHDSVDDQERLEFRIAIESIRTKLMYKHGELKENSDGGPNMVIKRHRDVSNNLIQELKEIEIKPLSETQDSRYGNGKCSNFGLLEKTTNEIRQLKEDIVTLIKKEMKMLPYGLETNSFLNVFSKGAGQPPHTHLRTQDKMFDRGKNKYSLVYYIDIGDQECEHPGLLRLHEPEETIKPTNGLIVIIPAARLHSVHYGGDKIRMMVGVNFYAFPT